MSCAQAHSCRTSKCFLTEYFRRVTAVGCGLCSVWLYVTDKESWVAFQCPNKGASNLRVWLHISKGYRPKENMLEQNKRGTSSPFRSVESPETVLLCPQGGPRIEGRKTSLSKAGNYSMDSISYIALVLSELVVLRQGFVVTGGKIAWILLNITLEACKCFGLFFFINSVQVLQSVLSQTLNMRIKAFFEKLESRNVFKMS